MIKIFVLACFFAIACFCLGAIIATLFEERRQLQIELGNAKNNDEKTAINDIYALRKKDNMLGLIFSIFAFFLTMASLLGEINDYEKDVLRDYVNGKYETETVVKTSTRGNNVQKDTTLYFYKIKK